MGKCGKHHRRKIQETSILAIQIVGGFADFLPCFASSLKLKSILAASCMCLWCHLWWDEIWQTQLDRNDVLPSSYLAAFSSHSQISLVPALGFWSLTPWTCNGCERAELSETPHTAYTLYRVRLPSWSLRRWRRYSYTRNRNSLAVTGKIMLTAQDSLPQETGWNVCLRFLILAHSPQLSSYLFPLFYCE